MTNRKCVRELTNYPTVRINSSPTVKQITGKEMDRIFSNVKEKPIKSERKILLI